MKSHFYIKFFLFLVAVFIYTHRLLSVPPGLETDEASIAYNSALISKTLKDQNDRFLPVFILSSDKHDWKQPILIYFAALLFKIFGISLTVYKMSNIIFYLSSLVLFMAIAYKIFLNTKYFYISTILYIFTPISIIVSRIGNESILPLFFSCLYLFFLFKYLDNQKYKWLALNAFSIGLSFYSFKGMRLIVPIWSIFTVYIIFLKRNIKNIKIIIKDIVIFSLILIPFLAITPLLELKYAGAVFDQHKIEIDSMYKFIHYWLSNISLAFWFTTPDIGKTYLVSDYGAILIACLPLFIYGFFNSFKKNYKVTLITVLFILTPSLFGLAHSLNYTHRLMASIPTIILIISYGYQILDQKISKFKFSILFKFSYLLLIIININNFLRYYYFEYPLLHQTKQAFGVYTYNSFLELQKLSHQYNLTPYVEKSIYDSEWDENKFYNIALFNNKLNVWNLGDPIKPNSILLTQNSSMNDLIKIYTDPVNDNLNIHTTKFN